MAIASGALEPKALWRQATLSHLVGVMSGLGLLFILGTFTYIASEQRDRLLTDAHRDVSTTAFVLADHAARLFEVSDVALRQAASISRDLPWEQIADSEQLFRQISAVRDGIPYLEDVWLNDEAGDLRLTSFVFPRRVRTRPTARSSRPSGCRQDSACSSANASSGASPAAPPSCSPSASRARRASSAAWSR